MQACQVGLMAIECVRYSEKEGSKFRLLGRLTWPYIANVTLSRTKQTSNGYPSRASITCDPLML